MDLYERRAAGVPVAMLTQIYGISQMTVYRTLTRLEVEQRQLSLFSLAV